ncbi:MAG: hypothetical protein NZL89_02620 [Leptospiraceae bacterium]|nr:hypothetical protein [Leptospiraceae bacterium]
MQLRNSTVAIVVLVMVLASACSRRPQAIDASLVDQVIHEFAAARLMHYLKGRPPQTNRQFLEEVLARHSLRYGEFIAVLRHHRPQLYDRLFSKK